MSPDADDVPEGYTVPVGLDDEFYSNYLYAKKVRDEAVEAYTQLDDELKRRLAAASDGCDARVLVDGQVVGKWTQVHSYRFDSSTFKRQFPDIHAQFQTKSSYWRWTPSRGDR